VSSGQVVPAAVHPIVQMMDAAVDVPYEVGFLLDFFFPPSYCEHRFS
jgi:hypothetical protein